jgi:polyisoprenoid-binding protein YceI
MIRTHASLRTLPLLAGMFVLLTFAPTLMAQQQSLDFTLDPATTAIHWTLNTTVHTVHGTFKLQKGSIRIDPATGNASGLIVIDAVSGESGDGTRDKRMDNVVLETGKYPTITFRPTHVSGKVDISAPGSITADGVMNLHGQDHPMQLTVDLQPRDSGVASKIHFEVPYVAWGMKDPSVMMFRVDKKVAIDIDATATSAANVAHLP